jgi:hypothetical protein
MWIATREIEVYIAGQDACRPVEYVGSNTWHCCFAILLDRVFVVPEEKMLKATFGNVLARRL